MNKRKTKEVKKRVKILIDKIDKGDKEGIVDWGEVVREIIRILDLMFDSWPP